MAIRVKKKKKKKKKKGKRKRNITGKQSKLILAKQVSDRLG